MQAAAKARLEYRQHSMMVEARRIVVEEEPRYHATIVFRGRLVEAGD